jgi:hypothetical protein
VTATRRIAAACRMLGCSPSAVASCYAVPSAVVADVARSWVVARDFVAERRCEDVGRRPVAAGGIERMSP